MPREVDCLRNRAMRLGARRLVPLRFEHVFAVCFSWCPTPRLSRGPAEGGAVGLNHLLGNNIRLGLARRSQLADYFEVSGTYFESHEELLSGLSNTRCPFQHRKFWVLVRREPSQAANALPRRKASCRLKLSKAICCDDSLSDTCEFIDCHGFGAQLVLGDKLHASHERNSPTGNCTNHRNQGTDQQRATLPHADKPSNPERMLLPRTTNR